MYECTYIRVCVRVCQCTCACTCNSETTFLTGRLLNKKLSTSRCTSSSLSWRSNRPESSHTAFTGNYRSGFVTPSSQAFKNTKKVTALLRAHNPVRRHPLTHVPTTTTGGRDRVGEEDPDRTRRVLHLPGKPNRPGRPPTETT